MISAGNWIRAAVSLTAITAATLIGTGSLCRADVYDFNLIPADGNVSGPAGSTVGWGYSITNDSATDWLLTINLNSDSFANGAASSLFDFPEVAPGATVTETFDPINSIGLFELTWDPDAPSSFINSGNFVLSAQWYDGDPFDGGNFIADAPDTNAGYSATVSSSVTPEPVLFPVIVAVLAALLTLRFWPRLKKKHVIAAGVLIAIGSGTARAQSASTPEESKEPGITRQQADDILLELRAIHQLLDRQVRSPAPQQPPAPVYPTTGKLKLDGEPTRGSANAPVTLVEFTDYECPFCRQFETATLPEILKKYVDTGKVRLVVHDFPLNIHANAMPAAEAAHCAGDQGKFWPMHDALFSEPGNLGTADLIDRAGTMKLDVGSFRTCLEGGKDRADVMKQMKTASDLQIVATPSFLIGKTAGDTVDGAIVTGAQPLSVFEAKLKEAEAAR
ncbi:MAG TPA: thioredoxin domain-containing protein [Bryobacteraceae bacterium]